MIGGTAICIAAVVALTTVMTGAPGSLPGGMIVVVAFGAGLGMFIAPNNSATISAAPTDKTGEAGGLLNLMLSGIGVAAAPSVLALRLELATGISGRTIAAAESALLAAVGDVLLMLAVFAIIAGCCVAASHRPRPTNGSFRYDGSESRARDGLTSWLYCGPSALRLRSYRTFYTCRD